MDHTKITREASGCVTGAGKFQEFLYELMRDHLPLGVVEGMVQSCLKHSGGIVYTNGWLADYAAHLVERLGVHSEISHNNRNAELENELKIANLGRT